MNTSRNLIVLLLGGAAGAWGLAPAARAQTATNAPNIVSIAKPVAGDTTIWFHGGAGPFRIQMRNTLDVNAPWFDLPGAKVTALQPGVYMGLIPNSKDDVQFYRVVSETETITDLKGWSILVQVSAPADHANFVVGESPVLTISLLDTFAQGITLSSFSRLNLYLYGPQDPAQTVTASKLLNANTDRTKQPHHYIDLKANSAVQVNGNQLTYALQPVSTEAPGTYRASVWAVLAADPLQQIMKFTDLQIGTNAVEAAVVDTSSCAACHQGPISGKLYMHHIQVSGTSLGNWSLDYEPVKTCKSCHNNDGYSAYSDPSVAGGKAPDPIVRRVHGVHMGSGLALDFNTNAVTGDFKNYVHVEFPADVRNCTECHQDERYHTAPSRLACAACHDNVWFGTKASIPSTNWVAHAGGVQTDDKLCALCHTPDVIDTLHAIPPPPMNSITVTLTPPANGTNYVAGEKPVVTLVFLNDTGTNAIDHTKVTDANFSSASLFVYGPRSLTVPVLTSAATNGASKLRASVSSSVPGPWPINGKVFKLAVNGSAPQNITIVGASNLVTATEVVASLNPVITNLNGGAIASLAGANVNLKTLIQGANARFEIYNGEVTTAMGWKRGPNTVMEPDVTIAASSTAGNDLRALSDPLDYKDPRVTRTAGNITYPLDDVAGLTPGTYGVYVYCVAKSGKVTNYTALAGLGHVMFQVGTPTPEKKIATNCTDCHGDTIFHLTPTAPIHPAPFDPDYCKACHDYLHTSSGDMFKNQGGTSLNGWSGFGAVPISRRVHGVHYAHYLEHPEEIYANATPATFGNIIFPQDVRNCTKCHAESDTWKQKPSRVACLACHDTDADKDHGKLMTLMLDPTDPYGPNSQETCVVCHGPGSDFSPNKVHATANPYVPPYPRDPSP